jgi:hypothetical protein
MNMSTQVMLQSLIKLKDDMGRVILSTTEISARMEGYNELAKRNNKLAERNAEIIDGNGGKGVITRLELNEASIQSLLNATIKSEPTGREKLESTTKMLIHISAILIVVIEGLLLFKGMTQ